MIEKYDGIKYNIREYLPVIFLFISLIGFGIYDVVKKGNYDDVYLSTKFDERVIDIYAERGNTFLLLTNKINRYRIEESRNYDYEYPFLYDFINENDRIIKNKCSDTIYIERNSKKYHFIIGSTSYNRKGKSKEFSQKYLNKRTIVNERNDCN